jgi:hypothetical protein
VNRSPGPSPIPAENSEGFRLRFFDSKAHVVGGWLDRVREAIRNAGRGTPMVHNGGGGGWPMDRDDYVYVENHPMYGSHGTRLAGKLMRALAPGKTQEYYPAWQIGCTDKPYSPAQLTHLLFLLTPKTGTHMLWVGMDRYEGRTNPKCSKQT